MAEKDETTSSQVVKYHDDAKTAIPSPEARSKSFDNDAAYAIQTCRRFLTILGVWNWDPAHEQPWRSAISSITVLAVYFGIGIRTLPIVVYMALDERDAMRMSNLVARVLFGIAAGMKYTYLCSRRQDIERCMSHIEFDWLTVETAAHRGIMLDYARFGHLVTRICAVFTFSGAVWYALLPLVVARKGHAAVATIDNNATLFVRPPRTFAVPSDFGVAFASKTPIYEVIYTSQVVATFLMHAIGVACYSLAVVIVMHACGQLKILMEKLGRLVEAEEAEDVAADGNFEHRLADIVGRHVRALRFISSAERMLREICLIDLGLGTPELCVLGYYILDWKNKGGSVVAIMAYVTLFITFLFNIFSFCYIGELLTQECSKVGEVTYMIDWHRLPGKQSLFVCLIVAMSHGGRSDSIVVPVFREPIDGIFQVIKTSMGYLNMMRAVMD